MQRLAPIISAWHCQGFVRCREWLSSPAPGDDRVQIDSLSNYIAFHIPALPHYLLSFLVRVSPPIIVFYPFQQDNEESYSEKGNSW